MRVLPIPCLKDNYAYLVISDVTGEAAIVDPSEAGPVVAAVRHEGVTPVAIWNTHHHLDHVGGNEDVLGKLGGMEVIGHASDKGRIPAQTRFVEDKERFPFAGTLVDVHHIPGHTTGAVAYFVDGVVFTGDTMFLAGCGRLFEGTPAMMHASLTRLASLPGTTQIYCGHEYTASNLRFAAHVEPDNADVQAAIAAAGAVTVPGTMDHEKKVNPFLRVTSPAIRHTLGIPEDADEVTALGAIRAAKDCFR